MPEAVEQEVRGDHLSTAVRHSSDSGTYVRRGARLVFGFHVSLGLRGWIVGRAANAPLQVGVGGSARVSALGVGGRG